MKSKLEQLRDFFADDGDEETRQVIRRELEQSGSDLHTFMANVAEVSRDWLPWATHSEETARANQSLNMTDLALRGRISELEREFRSCLPALLDQINVPRRERSNAFCDALVALIVQNSRNLEGRRFRACLAGWIDEFLSQRGFAVVKRLEDEDWEAVLTEVATNRALTRMEEALQPKPPDWFADFRRMVMEKPLGERIPLRSALDGMSERAEFASCQRVFDQEAVAAYRRLERFWELN